LPVWYRADGDDEWHSGVTESISPREAVIRATGDETPKGDVFIAIDLSDTGGCLAGRGRIARTFRQPAWKHGRAFSVAVRSFRLDRRDRVLNGQRVASWPADDVRSALYVH
jgi:hypothetical protein